MNNLIDLFETCVEKYRDNIFLLEKKDKEYTGITYKETRDSVYLFGAGLISMGIRKGDRIALISEGRNDWVISELGIFYAGAIDVPLSVKLSEAADIRFRLEHSETRFVIASEQQARKLSSVKASLQGLERIILLDPKTAYDDREIYFGEVMAMGRDYLKQKPEEFRLRWQSVTGDDIANICYTSGTTADPKGIMLSHRNYTANIEQSLSVFRIPPNWTTLLILPWDHAFTHTCGIYTLMSCGASLASVQTGKTGMETLRNIPVNIKEIKPNLLLSVPSLAKSFKKNIESGVREKGSLASLLFRKGLKIAYAYNGIGWNKGRGLRILLKPLYRLFDAILFSKVRQNFGGNLEYFVGGGALLDIDLQRFFYAIGIPMYQGYGLSEASPVISANNPSRHKLGSSGTLVTNLELKICDDNGMELPPGEKGEIVIRGENVMTGYWKNPESTKETIKDGWLHTGDMGYMDPDGFLYVLGRFKSLLIGDDGEKFSPEGIEESLVQHCSMIEQCMLYNNQNAYTTALIVPGIQALKHYLGSHNMNADASAAKELIRQVKSQIDQFLPGGKFAGMYPGRWLPASFAIVEEAFTEENHLMNSTLKIVRPKIIRRFQARLDEMYTPAGKNIYNDANVKTILDLLK